MMSKMTSLKIRKFASEDIGPVIELLQDVSIYRPKDDLMASLAHKFITSPNSVGRVLDSNGNVIGFGSMFVLDRIRGGNSGIIEDVVIAPHSRNQGLGRLLIEDLLDQARMQGCFKVTLESSLVGEKFYQAVGFKSAGRAMRFLL